ncbi:MAG TPA: hypothetical protein VM051_09185 [Usitatibacter sp.]|nr:hypothetical protein [Usitatibacter sp.]
MIGRKSSARVTLVLIGVAALAGCSRTPEERRDVYASREDCLADWGNKPEDCKPAPEARHSSHGFWYGPMYPIPYGMGSSAFSRGSSRSIGSSSSGTHSSSVSRGGFGSSARSSGG